MFSLLISVYDAENPLFFDEALKSCINHQTIKPTEVVIVQDGPIKNSLTKVINQYVKDNHEIEFKIIPLEKNVGLGKALNIGLSHCSYNLVARMDTDDIAKKTRFENQLDIFKNDDKLVIVGSNVSEFRKLKTNIVSERKVPENHKDIIKFNKYSNPFNHPSVMFKKDVILNIGSYQHMPSFEDYHLWSRLIKNGYKTYNIQENLVNMRIGDDFTKRRSGYRYLFKEFNFQKYLYKNNIIGKTQFLMNLFSRCLIRLFPNKILQLLYMLKSKLL